MSDADSSEGEKGTRGAASRSELQRKARKIQASIQSDSKKQTVKSLKSDLNILKKVTPQRQNKGNVPPPSPSSPISSPPRAGVPPLPDINLPSPPYRPGIAYRVKKR